LLIKTGVTAALPCRTEPTSYSPTGCTATTAYGPVATSPAASAPTGPPQHAAPGLRPRDGPVGSQTRRIEPDQAADFDPNPC
jgi:hypothetical protein